ncbi:peptidase M19 [Aestuariicella hydrocarbonica]|uniref:Peptidase M19 n=1 Tax=Pseudomaricurvus hydrocarbonicus TaxID=1470433 RepID=A0A9E5JY44_9GAMM|nr:dipeptidase [Aestuariicella hydrocarbonica]NHO64217.1 peptidase M19 [Aestuariicella hydrocarbonica]
MSSLRIPKIILITTSCILALAVGITAFWLIAPAKIEETQNRVIQHTPYTVSRPAEQLHQRLFIGDLHADSTLWKRNLLSRSERGHVDIPRLQAGNVALQMFTVVTKSPRGQNYDHNATETADNITLLAIAQTWPLRTWFNLTERALFQASKIRKIAQESPHEVKLILSTADLDDLQQRRQRGGKLIGAVIGTEGSHALAGNIDNIRTLYDAGFRMMSLHHFFDNKLGGSLHGESGTGLTEFGFQAVDEMLNVGVIIDVSHSSPEVVEDVLARSERPVLVSHSGFYGHCPSPRNISDKLMKRIAAKGGLIGVGYWDGAVCDPTPTNIVKAIRYGIDLIGVDHVALGSDFDGSVTTPFDVSELAVLTEEMLKAGFTETEIRKVMGENMARFLRNNLPQ